MNAPRHCDYNEFKIGTWLVGAAAVYGSLAYSDRVAPIAEKFLLKPASAVAAKIGTTLYNFDYNVLHTFTPFKAAVLFLTISYGASLVDSKLTAGEKTMGGQFEEHATWCQLNPYKRLALSYAVSGVLHCVALAAFASFTGAAFVATMPGAIIALTAAAFAAKVFARSVLPESYVGAEGSGALMGNNGRDRTRGRPFFNCFG